jgi:cytochrome c oxidase subunit II
VRKLLSLLVCAASALLLAANAAASDGGLGPVSPVTPNGQKANDAYWLIFALAVAIFVLVEGALVVFVVRFRSRGRARSVEGPDIHGSTKLETAWTIVPVLLLAAIATLVFVNLPGYVSSPKAERAGALHIGVVAHQFYWEFDYPGGVRAYDRMVVPADKLVLLTIRSEDVAHSWWIPAFGPKTDAIPGQTNHAWFKVKPSKVGVVYKGQCSELCGVLHAKMTETVQVTSQADFDVWLKRQAALAPAALGRQEFAATCAKCHGAEAQGFIGPSIAGSTIATDPAQLTPILQNGIRTMPAIGHGWTSRQIEAIAAYFKSKPFNGGSSGK